jgi:hypothetical protein
MRGLIRASDVNEKHGGPVDRDQGDEREYEYKDEG